MAHECNHGYITLLHSPKLARFHQPTSTSRQFPRRRTQISSQHAAQPVSTQEIEPLQRSSSCCTVILGAWSDLQDTLTSRAHKEASAMASKRPNGTAHTQATTPRRPAGSPRWFTMPPFQGCYPEIRATYLELLYVIWPSDPALQEQPGSGAAWSPQHPDGISGNSTATCTLSTRQHAPCSSQCLRRTDAATCLSRRNNG